jgi:Glycosyltransferase
MSMAEIAVLHNTLDFHGGADAVCLAVCDALQESHAVSLITCSVTSPAMLADRFDIDLDTDALDIVTPPGGTLFARALAGAAPVVGSQLPFRSAVLRQFFLQIADQYDVAVSTANEFSLPLPSVQYIHYPQFRANMDAKTVVDDYIQTESDSQSQQHVDIASSSTHSESPGLRVKNADQIANTTQTQLTETREQGDVIRDNCVEDIEYDNPNSDDAGNTGYLNQIWTRLAAPDDKATVSDSTESASTTFLTNSTWTASVVTNRYNINPVVCHPPVDPIYNDSSWGERENGVVVVGRLAPDKRPLDAISIVDAIRAHGRDLHLHIVGTAPDAYRDYARTITTEAANRSYVSVEEDVPRSRLETLLCTHKYGLNLKPREHFGLSVAEYVAAGMVAFAPASGGQVDVLDGQNNRLFESFEDAVYKIDTAITTDERPQLPRDRFNRDRFDESIVSHVEQMISR